jgi:hypothetical protein
MAFHLPASHLETALALQVFGEVGKQSMHWPASQKSLQEVPLIH